MLVRLTSMRGVNLDLFDFDYDLTWMAFFINADGKVYGRYGGRAAESADGLISLAGLRYALEQAAAAHRLSLQKGPVAAPRKARTVEDYPPAKRRQTSSCIHCHHVYDFRRETLQAAGQWRLDDLWVYPLPENVGLTLDVDQGDRLQRVAVDSAAARLGLAAGDKLQMLNGIAIASFADVQCALHRAPAFGTIPVPWRHDGKDRSGRLLLTQGWRKTDLSWRWSLNGLEPVPWVQGADLTPAEKKKLGLPVNRLAIYQGNFLSTPARQAGIEQGDVIIGVDNKMLEMTARQFQAYIRLNYKVGDRVTYNLLRDGRRVDIPLTLLKRPAP